MNKVIFGNNGIAVVKGAVCKCSFGDTPNTLSPSPLSTMEVSGKKVLTVQDINIGLNIPPVSFTTCKGIPPTPAIPKPPCNIMLTGDWIGEPCAVKVNGVSILTDKHQILCSNPQVTLGSGVITIEYTGQ